MKSMITWRDYFVANKNSVREVVWPSEITDAQAQASALARSLSHFALGESGDGKHIRALAAEVSTERNAPEYLEAVNFFVKEENGHARLLDSAVAYLGGRSTASHWTETAFIFLRRLISLQMEVNILAIAEVIGLNFYGMVSERTKNEGVKEMCAIFLREETEHLSFDADSVVWLNGGRPSPVFRGIMRAIFEGTLLAAWIDHGPTLRAYGWDLTAWRMRCAVTYRVFNAQMER